MPKKLRNIAHRNSLLRHPDCGEPFLDVLHLVARILSHIGRHGGSPGLDELSLQSVSPRDGLATLAISFSDDTKPDLFTLKIDPIPRQLQNCGFPTSGGQGQRHEKTHTSLAAFANSPCSRKVSIPGRRLARRLKNGTLNSAPVKCLLNDIEVLRDGAIAGGTIPNLFTFLSADVVGMGLPRDLVGPKVRQRHFADSTASHVATGYPSHVEFVRYSPFHRTVTGHSRKCCNDSLQALQFKLQEWEK
ncbi:hypothetical protein NO932_15900 [Pelagibacterium sp. 26DY04]|uniref:hypothetical protein n=1 Tax=Pelagibacterium sp. 26DY04 TaxID=2967130 RepID=UPI0028168A54|nr:hypothetical protein [Pelagibacterium sp. 26DY04]WMT86383.1 hypothetical protein NO932_15900 [Pelagibacterium sp. 26DY04]